MIWSRKGNGNAFCRLWLNRMLPFCQTIVFFTLFLIVATKYNLLLAIILFKGYFEKGNITFVPLLSLRETKN